MLKCEKCGEPFFQRGVRRFCTERCRKWAEKARARLRTAPVRAAIKEAQFIARMREVLARPLRPTLADRLEKYSIPEPNTGCRLWIGRLKQTRAGVEYGELKVGGRYRRAHRVAYEVAKGVIPAGALVCHRCDVGICIEPDHLYAGTARTNFDDMVKRGRYKPPPGSRKNASSLSVVPASGRLPFDG